MKRYAFLALLLFVLCPPAFAIWNNDVNDPCPTYDDCTMTQQEYSAEQCAATYYASCYREVSYRGCIKYHSCVDTKKNAEGKVIESKCTADLAHACAYQESNPYLCGTLYVRRADCGRL